MNAVIEKFKRLSTVDAPGQEVRQRTSAASLSLRGGNLSGQPVDFSHGDVDAFEPTPAALQAFTDGFRAGGSQAYTEYRGSAAIRAELATKLTHFTGAPVDGIDDLIITNGTQGALFLAVASTVAQGTKVAIVEPDYFANRKLVEFLGGEVVPLDLYYLNTSDHAGLDLARLEDAFKAGVKVFLFSNPNNPVGAVYSAEEIRNIACLAERYRVTLIVDQLYSRLLYEGQKYHHLRGQGIDPELVVTVMGPSKTESLSGFRLGVAFGATGIIDRMEKLQAIVSLRAAGYNQAVLRTWFSEPDGWMDKRIALHEAIRNGVLQRLSAVNGLTVRLPQAGSYVFPQLPKLAVSAQEFVHILRIQAGVTVASGSQFGGASHGSIRLNFSQDYEATLAAVNRIVKMIERYRHD